MKALLLLTALVACHPAHAKNLNGRWDNARWHEWYGKQHTASGLWCCDQSDAEPFFGGYVINKDGSVDLDNGTHIPVEKVMTDPNPTGAPAYRRPDLVFRARYAHVILDRLSHPTIGRETCRLNPIAG